MFFYIPLAIIAGSLIGIGYIVWPKLEIIKKNENLERTFGGREESFLRLMFPELFYFLKSLKARLRVLRENLMIDYEKFLRKARIVSLKTDNIINKLLESRPRRPGKVEFRRPEKSFDQQENLYFKNKESYLISEIAKNPKDKNLYKALGALYLENQMYKDAKEALKVVLELDPADKETLENIEKIGNLS